MEKTPYWETSRLIVLVSVITSQAMYVLVTLIRVHATIVAVQKE
jgi:hypothetical protein